MTLIEASAITFLSESVIRPVSKASADCAWSMPRSSTHSKNAKSNLRKQSPVYFGHVAPHHRDIIPQNKNRSYHKPRRVEKRDLLRLTDPELSSCIRLKLQICTSFRQVLRNGSKTDFSGRSFAI